MGKVTIDYLGMWGTGRTKTEAKQDAARRIEEALGGSYTPVILTAGGETILMYRDPLSGWSYHFVRDGELTGGCFSMDDRFETERQARRHLGGLATDWRTCQGPDDVHPIVQNQEDRRDIARGCQWQRDYQTARAAGLDDANARYFIGGFTQFMTQPIPPGLAVA